MLPVRNWNKFHLFRTGIIFYVEGDMKLFQCSGTLLNRLINSLFFPQDTDSIYLTSVIDLQFQVHSIDWIRYGGTLRIFDGQTGFTTSSPSSFRSLLVKICQQTYTPCFEFLTHFSVHGHDKRCLWPPLWLVSSYWFHEGWLLKTLWCKRLKKRFKKRLKHSLLQCWLKKRVYNNYKRS